MEQTKYCYLARSDQEKGLPQPPLELPTDPGLAVINLKKPDEISVPTVDLRTAIERCHSVRSYANESLSCDEFSFLLWCTQGIKSVHGSQGHIPYCALSECPSCVRDIPAR